MSICVINHCGFYLIYFHLIHKMVTADGSLHLVELREYTRRLPFCDVTATSFCDITAMAFCDITVTSFCDIVTSL